MEMVKGDNYWSQKESEIFELLKTSRNGLAEKEAESRRKEYGLNEIKRKRPAFLILLRQFKSPLIWLLIMTSIVSMFFGETISAVIILVIIFLTSMFSFIQEFRAEKTSEDLNKKISHRTIVVRDNEKKEIEVKYLVPGDIIVLNIGDKVPADLRLIESRNLEVDESILTGESVPVHKVSAPVKNARKIQDFKNHVFAGTIIAGGEALGVVIGIGEESQIGKLSKEVTLERPEVEFQKGIKKFVKLLLYIVVIATIIIFFTNFILKNNVLDSLLFALAIAIGITPELLPVIITIGLSRGAKVMAKKDVIVKRLVSIEDFGNMDILCTDKTGTLTEGNIQLYDYINCEGKKEENVLLYSLLCNSANVHGKKIFGNSIDAAILKYENKQVKEKSKTFEKISEIPFDYSRKKMSVIVRHEKEQILISKGAPRLMLKICSKVYINGRTAGISSHLKKIEKRYMELSEQGLRVIAVAYKKVNKKSYSKGDEKDLIFLGFLTFSDPPKKTIKDSLEKLKSLNIDLKILTGDNEIITQKIAREVGIPIKKIVLGDEMEKYSEEELKKIVDEANIFCRLDPLQKQKIIRMLKDNGHDIGYIGDGVNDIAALHEADIGISVDSAVDVAKDASDIILLKKSLGILAEGVIEGRKIFRNSMKYIMIGVSSDFGNMVSMSVASFFLPFLPMLPPQILFNDLVYDVSQSTVPNDNVDTEYLRKPKKFNLDLIKKYMLWFGPLSSVYDFATFAVLIFFFKANDIMFQTGWFIESISTQILVFFVIRTRRSPFWKSKPAKAVLISCIGAVLIAIITPFTPLGKMLGFTNALPGLFFVFLAGVIGTYLLFAEIGKRIFFKKYDL